MERIRWALEGLVAGPIPVNSQLFSWQQQCLKEEDTEATKDPAAVVSTCAGCRRDTQPGGARLGPATRSATGASLPHPRPFRARSQAATGALDLSLSALRSPCYSPAPPLGPSLTSPRARGPPGSQRPQASRSAISAPLRLWQQQLWWHERLKTRTTFWAQPPAV